MTISFKFSIVYFLKLSRHEISTIHLTLDICCHENIKYSNCRVYVFSDINEK